MKEKVKYRGADKSLARPERKQATATEDLMFIYPIYYHNWRNISTIYTLHIIWLASNEIFSPSNKIHREVGRAKDLSAPRKSKGKGHPIRGHEGQEGEQKYSSTLSLISALDVVGDQRHTPAALPPGKDPVHIV